MSFAIFRANILVIVFAFFLSACGGGSSSSPSSTPQPTQSPTGTPSPTPTPTPTESPSPTPTPDATPDSFSFTPRTGAALNSQIESNIVTITGINTDTDISIAGGLYSVNGGAFISSSSSVANNDSVQIQLTSSNLYTTLVSATLTIGGVSSEFEVTTLASSNPVAMVDVNLDVRHSVGGIDSFDRRKFINVHASNTENDWWSGNGASRGEANASDDLITEFLEGYDVYLGRDTGGMAWQLSQLEEDSSRPGFVSETAASTRGTSTKNWYSANPSDDAAKARQHEHRATDMVVAAQQHPYWPDGTLTGQGWAFSQADTQDEPFGTATGHYMGQFLAKYFNQGGSDTNGQPKPTFVEVMNEPLYDLVDASSQPTTPERVFHFHNAVADEIRRQNPEAQIGGYTVAFPDFEVDNFARWEQRHKLFLDIAGANMDYISLHFYDFPAFQNSQRYRKGSNIEATFDMLENYTSILEGQSKPMLISEYGAQVHSLINDTWSPFRDWKKMTAMNALMMSFMERPHLILKAIPFIPIKAEWGRTTKPYNDRLMRQAFEAEGESGNEWVYTEMVKFFQLWAEVNGTRVDSWSSEADLVVDSYVNGNTAFVVVNNLEFESADFQLNLSGLDTASADSFEVRQLFLQGDSPQLTSENITTLPDHFTVEAESTLLIKINLNQAPNIDESSLETKYFATSMQQAITADTPIQFSVNDVNVTSEGEAILRLGIGRDHGLSLQPVIRLNNTSIPVPTDFRGYDQYLNGSGRPSFFGLLEIPIPYDLLQSNNTITVEFGDAGGFVTTAGLQVFNFTRQIQRPM